MCFYCNQIIKMAKKYYDPEYVYKGLILWVYL
jgi:hypothetical protein